MRPESSRSCLQQGTPEPWRVSGQFDGSGISATRVSPSKAAFDMHGGFSRFTGKFEALLSTRYAAAVSLHDRELSLAQFEPARCTDPKLGQFASDRMEVSADPSLVGSQALVEADTVDGSIILPGDPPMRLTPPSGGRR